MNCKEAQGDLEFEQVHKELAFIILKLSDLVKEKMVVKYMVRGSIGDAGIQIKFIFRNLFSFVSIVKLNVSESSNLSSISHHQP